MNASLRDSNRMQKIPFFGWRGKMGVKGPCAVATKFLLAHMVVPLARRNEHIRKENMSGRKTNMSGRNDIQEIVPQRSIVPMNEFHVRNTAV